jgi:uncharacterized protein YbaP (TraB family)
MRKVSAFLLALCLASPASAAPSLWHVKGPRGDVTLFGSIHILPPSVHWRGPALDAAIKHADVFVFEAPGDDDAKARVAALIAARGFLPPGQSLRASLPPLAQTQFDAALTAAHLPLAAIDRERPWLASLQILMSQMASQKYGRSDGVDVRMMDAARFGHKQMRYFETIEQQFALIAPTDEKLEMEEFLAALPDMADANAELQPMVDAWQRGDQNKLNTLINGDMAQFPAARKALLDDRNKRFALQIETMLREKRRFFITIGAGHLTGPLGVPELLRAAGYKVESP